MRTQLDYTVLWVGVYLIFTGLITWDRAVRYASTRRYGADWAKREAARALLLAPLWPATLPVAAVRFLASAVRDAR